MDSNENTKICNNIFKNNKTNENEEKSIIELNNILDKCKNLSNKNYEFINNNMNANNSEKNKININSIFNDNHEKYDKKLKILINL